MTMREGRVRSRWARGAACGAGAALAVLPGYVAAGAAGARGRDLAPVADEMPAGPRARREVKRR